VGTGGLAIFNIHPHHKQLEPPPYQDSQQALYGEQVVVDIGADE
jgi:hypothetical protein